MKKKMATRSSRPFTRSQRSKILLSLPDHLTQMVFDSLSTKHAAILSSVNIQLRTFALSHTPASWQNIFIQLPNAEKLDSLLMFLSKRALNAKSFELYIDTNAIDINALQIFPVLPNVYRLILSRNRWLECDHLELLANRMPAVTQLEIDGCDALRDIQGNRPADGCLEIVDRQYGRQLTVFSCGIYGLQFHIRNNVMVGLMTNFLNIVKFNIASTGIAVPNPVVAAMLSRSPEISELMLGCVRPDAETQTFLFALSSCRHLTHLSLSFAGVDRFQGDLSVKPWALLAAFGGLRKLKILKLFISYRVMGPDLEGGEGEGQIQNLPFQLSSLHITMEPNLHPFFLRLVLSQIEYLNILTLRAPNFAEIMSDVFAQPRPRLRRLSIDEVDYLSEHFTPPEAGYRHILNRAPALERLSALTENSDTVGIDQREILHVLAREYPHCDVDIDMLSMEINSIVLRHGGICE